MSLVLLVPVIGIFHQDTVELELFHNRTLVRWPSGKLFWSDPAQYFSKAQSWLSDRPFPIIQATYFKNNFLYSILDTLPQRRVSQGRDGFLFLNGTDEGGIDNVLNDACIEAPKSAEDGTLQTALSELSQAARIRGYPIDVVLVPTLPALYGDRLPHSIPGPFRHACARIASGHSPLLDMRSPAGVHFVYPFPEMKAHRDDEAFFPKANYHPYGLSLTVVRNAYLAAIGAQGAIDETLTLTPHLSEDLSNYGIARYPPAYEVSNLHVKEREDIETALDDMISAFSRIPETDSHAYQNDEAPNPETIMILSDSYGDSSSGIWAGAFGRILQVHLPDDGIADLVRQLSRRFPFQRLVLFFNEGNVARIRDVGAALRAADAAGPGR